MGLIKLGLYEQILDDATQTAIADLNQEHIQVLRRHLDAGDRHSYLVRGHGSTVLLFVRQEKRRNGLAVPYSFLGPADYVNHQGSRPMNIIWKLRHPMSAKYLQKAARLLNE